MLHYGHGTRDLLSGSLLALLLLAMLLLALLLLAILHTLLIFAMRLVLAVTQATS